MSERKYFEANCWKCDVALVVPVREETASQRYYCQACAYSVIGA